MRQKKENLLLTEVELEFMNILWRLGSAAVQDILDNLDKGRDLAYTSAATIMRILDEKGFLSMTKVSRSYVYTPTISKQEYQTRLLQSVAQKAFDDTPVTMVARLIEDENLSKESLKDIRKLLDQKTRSK